MKQSILYILMGWDYIRYLRSNRKEIKEEKMIKDKLSFHLPALLSNVDKTESRVADPTHFIIKVVMRRGRKGQINSVSKHTSHIYQPACTWTWHFNDNMSTHDDDDDDYNDWLRAAVHFSLDVLPS